MSLFARHRTPLRELELPQIIALAREQFKALLMAANSDASVTPPRTFGQAAQLTRSASHVAL